MLVALPVVLFGVLFLVLDLTTGMEPTDSTSYVLGMSPPMAWYLLGFPPLVVLAGILYAVTFEREDPEPAGSPQAAQQASGDKGEISR